MLPRMHFLFILNKGGMIMNLTDYVVFFWLLPVVLCIIFPLLILCGWAVVKLPSLLFGRKKPRIDTEPLFAR